MIDEPEAVDSDWRSAVDSNVDLDNAGCCMLSAMAAGLETAAMDSDSRLVFLVAAKVVVDVAAARSLRCMEVADRAVLVDGAESSVNRRSNHSLPSLYVGLLYQILYQNRRTGRCRHSTRLQRNCFCTFVLPPSLSSRLISCLLIVSADLRVILISRPGCVFPPRTLFTTLR